MRAILERMRAPQGIFLVVAGGFVLMGRLVPPVAEPRRAELAAPGATPGSPRDMTPDGRFLVYQTSLDTLVPDDDNLRLDVILKDNVQHTLRLVSVTADHRVGNGDSVEPTVSDDGRFVAFRSISTNFVPGDTNRMADIYLKDMITGALVLVSEGLDGAPANDQSARPRIRGDGRAVTFKSWASNLVPDDDNDRPDFFTRDLETGAMRRVSSDE